MPYWLNPIWKSSPSTPTNKMVRKKKHDIYKIILVNHFIFVISLIFQLNIRIPDINVSNCMSGVLDTPTVMAGIAKRNLISFPFSENQSKI